MLGKHDENQYLNLLSEIKTHGRKRTNRTGINTLQLFGAHMIFDLSAGQFPLITTKKMFWNGIMDEFLFFFSGHTNISNLPERSRHWWDKWITSDGDIGPLYPKQYRNYENKYGNIDQLKILVDGIIKDPDSRRHLLTSYNPADIVMAREKDPQLLYVCHGLITQFDVYDGVISLSTYQRSMDTFIGGAVNIAHYGLLLHSVAKQCNLKVGCLNYFIGDAHIYENHTDQVETQIARKPYDFPQLKIKDDFDIFNMSADDFEIVNYTYHPAIKAVVAI